MKSRITYGNRYADWTFCPDGINKDSIIYSFGVGEDISFDLQLIENFQLHVHAFDPSPDSLEWVSGQNITEKFHLYPFGLADTDGEISFCEPAEPGYKSLRMIDHLKQHDNKGKSINLPVHKLITIIGDLGHEIIDILKMDIEGAEYNVIEDIINCPVKISQILIEFHHRFDKFIINDTRRAIARLNSAGYMIFNVSASGEEYSFIKTSGHESTIHQ